MSDLRNWTCGFCGVEMPQEFDHCVECESGGHAGLTVGALADLAARTETESVVRNAVSLVRERKPLFQARHGVSLFGSEASVSGFNFNS